MKLKKIISLAFMLMLFFFPTLTLAQTTDSANIELLTRSLRLQMRGEDVKVLQKFLAEEPEIYSENLVTGYFGLKTETAVKKWQKKYGIEAVGIVGPKTISKIKELNVSRKNKSEDKTISEDSQETNAAEAVIQPTTTNDTEPPTASLILKTPAPTKIYIKLNPSEEVTAVYEYGTTIYYGSTEEVSNNFFSSLTGAYIENLTPSTTYQVRVKITDRVGNIGYSQNYTFTTPSTSQAPLLSSGPDVSSNNAIPSTSVTINWETNIPCVGTLYYGTNTTFGNFVRSDETRTTHNSIITGLASGITYIYKLTCATINKTFESDNYLFTATSSTYSIINSPTLASVLESFKNILEKIISLIKEK